MTEADVHEERAREAQDHYGLTPELLRAILEALDQEDVNRLEALVVPLHAADVADLLEQITSAQRAQVIGALEPDIDPDILAYLGENTLDDVRNLLGNDGFASLVRQLDVDDAVEVIGELDDAVQQEILAAVPAAERRMVEEALTFPEESAGRLMRRDVVALPMFWNIGQTIDFLRSSKDLPSEFYAVFVVDPAHKPVGMITLSDILRNARDVKLAALVEGEPTTVAADTDQEEVAYLFQQYGLTEVAVVDGSGRLLGAITFDDMVDVMNEESEEDVLRLGGVTDSDLHDSVFATTRKRIPWLMINAATAVLAASVIGLFQATIEQMVALAVLMPIVASMGGNAGTQAMTVTVRALATKDLTSANALRNVTKECWVGLLNGILLALVVGGLAWAWFGIPMLGAVIGTAMIVNLLVAGTSGALLPLALQRLGIDPAVATGVFLTTVTDIVGFFVFLGLGAIFLL